MPADQPSSPAPQAATNLRPAQLVALGSAPEASAQSAEFWLLALLLAAIQVQIAQGRLSPIGGHALCVVAALAFTAARSFLKAHHTSQLASLALAAMDLRRGDQTARLFDYLASIVPVAVPANGKSPMENGKTAAAPSALSPQPSAFGHEHATGGYISPALARTIALISGLAVAALIALPLLLMSGCTQLVVKDGTTGRTKLQVQSNAAHIAYSDGTAALEVDGLDNASTTKAAWDGGNQMAATIGGDVVSGIATHGLTKGLGGSASSSTTLKAAAPAAVVGTAPHLTRPKPAPAATPAPSTPAPASASLITSRPQSPLAPVPPSATQP